MNKSKRFKHDYTLLEHLPNELFIEIFGYLNSIDTVYAFSQLNNRFLSLLNNYVKIFDFKSINKAKFDFIIQQHNIHQWQSLRLSEDDETPGQIKLFCQLFSLTKYISQLQSLSILNMKPTYTQKFFSQLISFDYLISLSIGKICGQNIQSIKLPSLKRLIITSCKHTNWIMNFQCLESLEYTIEYSCYHDYMLTLPTTLKQLKMFYDEKRDGNTMRTSLRQLSQLIKLSLYDNGNYSPLPDGQKWEELIQLSLPLLKTFQFCFSFKFYSVISSDLNQVIASFSTPFYLFEKRWFIRCDSDTNYPGEGTLYSLPFVFSRMPININSFDTSISTLFTSDNVETKNDLYGKVKTLVFNKECKVPDQGYLTTNIVQLILKARITTNWFFLLTELRHLEIENFTYMSSNDFAHLFASTPHLRSLIITVFELERITDKFKNKAVCDQLSHRIQSLTIGGRTSDGVYLDVVSVRCLSSLVRIFAKKMRTFIVSSSSTSKHDSSNSTTNATIT